MMSRNSTQTPAMSLMLLQLILALANRTQSRTTTFPTNIGQHNNLHHHTNNNKQTEHLYSTLPNTTATRRNTTTTTTVSTSVRNDAMPGRRDAERQHVITVLNGESTKSTDTSTHRDGWIPGDDGTGDDIWDDWSNKWHGKFLVYYHKLSVQ